MFKILKSPVFILDLQLFAEGADGGAGADAGAGENGMDAASVTGEGAPDAEVQTGEESTTDDTTDSSPKEKTYSEKEVQKLIKARAKKADDARRAAENEVAKLKKASPILAQMAKKYNVKDPTDIDAIMSAYEADDSNYEDEALRRGMPVSELRRSMKMEAELNAANEQLRQIEEDRKATETVNRWYSEAEATKQIYPSFDFDTEFRESRDFRELLKAGIDVKTAYQALHQDEILPAAMQHAADKTREKVTKDIAARGRRPKENGLSAQGTTVTVEDVANLTDEQIDLINKRVAAGEIITFS